MPPKAPILVRTAGGRTATVIEKKQRGWFVCDLDGNANEEGKAHERKTLRRPHGFAPGQDHLLDSVPQAPIVPKPKDDGPKNERWKNNDAQRKRIKDHVTPLLEALPEGGKLSLGKDFMNTVLKKCYFTESARNAVRSYISDHLLKAEQRAKAPNTTKDIDLVVAKPEDLVTREGAFFIANNNLNIEAHNKQNEHPEKARLREEPVPILDEDDEEVVAAALQSAHDKATAMLLFYKSCAGQAARIEADDPERWARVKEIYDEYAKEKSFRFDVGYRTSGIPGAALERSRDGKGELRVNVKGSKFHGQRRPNNEQGQKEIKAMIKETASTALKIRVRNKAAKEALATGKTTVKDLVAERFGGTAGPDSAKSGLDAADAPMPPAETQPRAASPAPARRVASRAPQRTGGPLSEEERWEADSLEGALAAAAFARALGLRFAPSQRAMRKWEDQRERHAVWKLQFTAAHVIDDTVLRNCVEYHTAATSSNTVAWATTRRAIRRSSTVTPSRRSRRAFS